MQFVDIMFPLQQVMDETFLLISTINTVNLK